MRIGSNFRPSELDLSLGRNSIKQLQIGGRHAPFLKLKNDQSAQKITRGDQLMVCAIIFMNIKSGMNGFIMKNGVSTQQQGTTVLGFVTSRRFYP